MGFSPIADTREDMRGHMLCVGGVGSDFGVQPRCVEPLLGNRRVVVKMDEIVRDTGMLRLTSKNRFEDRRAFKLIGVGLVGR